MVQTLNFTKTGSRLQKEVSDENQVDRNKTPHPAQSPSQADIADSPSSQPLKSVHISAVHLTTFPYHTPSKPAAGGHQLPKHAQASGGQTLQGVYSVPNAPMPNSATFSPWTPNNAHGAFYFPSASPQEQERFRTVSPLGFTEMPNEGGQQLLNSLSSNQHFQSWTSSAASTPRQFNPFWSPSPQISPTNQQQGHAESQYQYLFAQIAEPPLSNNGSIRGGVYGVTEQLFAQGSPVGFESLAERIPRGLGADTPCPVGTPRYVLSRFLFFI